MAEITVKEAKDCLLQIKLLNTQIDCMQANVDSLRDSLLRITPTLKQDVVTSSGTQDRMSATVAKIVDLEKEINAKIDTYIDKKAEIIRLLESVRNPDYLKVLQMRYVDIEKWEDIAVAMDCSVRNVHKLHGRALQVFAKIMEEDRNGKTSEKN